MSDFEVREQNEVEELVQQLIVDLPSLNTVEELEQLEEQGYNVRRGLGSRIDPSLIRTERDRMKIVNKSQITKAKEFHSTVSDDEVSEAYNAASIIGAEIVLDFTLDAPVGISVCERNPKFELPLLASFGTIAAFDGVPVHFVVPCCPDNDLYKLGSGLGRIVPKGLSASEMIHDRMSLFGIKSMFDIQLADVEASDPVLLRAMKETTESFLEKVSGTMDATRAEVDRMGASEYMAVSSMQDAFNLRGINYLQTQSRAADAVIKTSNKGVKNTYNELLCEREKLRDFAGFDEKEKRDLVASELAGYAAYGEMVDGKSIILSPDAVSAVPAYHYLITDKKGYSPVMYMR